jgi:hypothetical protein
MKKRGYNGVERADFWLAGIASRIVFAQLPARQSKLAARIVVLCRFNFLPTTVAIGSENF